VNDGAATLGLFGGAFDPPHRGHVELAHRAKEELGLGRLLVLVTAAPGHKAVETPAEVRLELARAAFPDDEVVLDGHPRTVDMLRAHPEWQDAIFLIGADEFSDFPTWKDPDEVLARVRLGVATRPGFPRERLQEALAQLERPDRVLFFEIEPTPVASRALRERLENGEDVRDDVPAAVAEIIGAEGLYEASRGYTERS
jgi:nicotinate-nucleotide adenylyltransferase